jgi:hypothetical protein
MIRNRTIWCDAVGQFGEFVEDNLTPDNLCAVVASGKRRPHQRIAAWAALCHRYSYNPADVLIARLQRVIHVVPRALPTVSDDDAATLRERNHSHDVTHDKNDL